MNRFLRITGECALMLASVLALTSCEQINGSVCVDWAPVNIYITATDADGNSIISPDMPGMSLIFMEDTFTVRDQEDIYSDIYTKAYLAIPSGLFAEPYAEEDGETLYRLNFGQIDGAADMDEDILLSWPDGSRDIIHYHCSDHKESKHPRCNRSWKLNGVSHEGNMFTFTGKSASSVPDK